jgi:hypothetical protein
MRRVTRDTIPKRWRDNAHLGERIEDLRARLLVFLALGLLLVLAGLMLFARGRISGFVLGIWLLLTPVVLYAVSSLLLALTGRAGTGLAHILFATGGERHSREYSEQQALVVAGRFDEAVDSYRAHLVAFPNDMEARVRLAALYAGGARQPDAAEHLLLEVRGMPHSPRHEQVVGNALIDLYRSTGQRHALKAELARFARVHHGSVAGEQARQHLRHLVEEDHRVS